MNRTRDTLCAMKAILALTQDLFLLPRLEDAARQLGFQFEVPDSVALGQPDDGPPRPIPLTEPLAGALAGLVRRLAGDPPALILIDLANPSHPWDPTIQTLKTSSATRRIPIVAFGPHVEAGALDRAKALGADRVVTRGQFQSHLAEILQAEARPPDEAAIREGCHRELPAAAVSGMKALATGGYFQAHDDFERAILEEPGPEGNILRCLLHLSVAYLHTERGNWRGAQKMLLRMQPWLASLPAQCRGVDVTRVRGSLEELQAHLDRWHAGEVAPATLSPPQIPFAAESGS